MGMEQPTFLPQHAYLMALYVPMTVRTLTIARTTAIMGVGARFMAYLTAIHGGLVRDILQS